jgi:hypothetical protein
MIISAVDLVTEQKRLGCQALAARKWFAQNGPADAPPLPLSYDEREALKYGGLHHIIAWFARSLAGRDYDWSKHPSFYVYSCGVMASEYTLSEIKNDQELLRRFPPCPLEGLDHGMDWNPPELHAQIMASYRRGKARAAS